MEIRKEILFLTRTLDIGTSADAREKVIGKVKLQIARLGRRMDALERQQLEAAAGYAHKDAARKLDSVVRSDPKYTKELIGLIKERGGGGMAAVFTQSMTKTAVTALRNAVVGAFQENALAGGTARDLANLIRDRWEMAAGNVRNFRFFDKAGREWDTNRYIQMSVRTNSMKIYNETVIRDYLGTTGSDIARITRDGRVKLSCEMCQFWAGKFISISGKTKGLPTYEQAEAEGMFHPNCIHTLDPADAELDAEEIEEQKATWADDRRAFLAARRAHKAKGGKK